MLLGVDAGGTSTRAVLLDRSGRCLGYGSAGGGNPVSWGADAAAVQIAAAARAALQEWARQDGARREGAQREGVQQECARQDGAHREGAQREGAQQEEAQRAQPAPGGGDPDAPAGVAVLAMAGGSAFAGGGVIEDALAAAGLALRVVVASDLLATFCSGSPALDGYALVSGTGAAAVRVRDGAVDSSVDGLGWLLGDAGSGFWIGHRVARAALAAVDGRGPATTLTGLVMGELGITVDGSTVAGRPAELQAAVDVLYRRRPVELSRFAELAFRAGGAGDRVAAGILDGARDRLVASLVAVRAEGVTGPVVLGGGVARRLPGFAAAIADAFAPGAPDVVTVTDGTVGAGVLALRCAGVPVDEAVFARVTESVALRR